MNNMFKFLGAIGSLDYTTEERKNLAIKYSINLKISAQTVTT